MFDRDNSLVPIQLGLVRVATQPRRSVPYESLLKVSFVCRSQQALYVYIGIIPTIYSYYDVVHSTNKTRNIIQYSSPFYRDDLLRISFSSFGNQISRARGFDSIKLLCCASTVDLGNSGHYSDFGHVWMFLTFYLAHRFPRLSDITMLSSVIQVNIIWII